MSYESNSNQSIHTMHSTNSFAYDITTDKPMFPDAMHDRYVKSVCSGQSNINAGRSSNSTSHRSSNLGSAHSGSSSIYSMSYSNCHVSESRNPSNYFSSDYRQRELDPRRNIPSRPNRLHSLDSSYSRGVQSEPILDSNSFRPREHYYDKKYEATCKQSKYDGYMEGKQNPPFVYDRNKFNRLSTQYDRNDCHSEQNYIRSHKLHDLPETLSMNNERKRLPLHQELNNNYDHPSYDDMSTIPSEEFIDHSTRKFKNILSIPRNIKYNNQDDRFRSPSRVGGDRIFSSSIQNNRLSNVKESSSDFYCCENSNIKYTSRGSQIASNRPDRDTTHLDSSSVNNEQYQHPPRHIQATAVCTSMDSETYPNTDRYLHQSCSSMSNVDNCDDNLFVNTDAKLRQSSSTAITPIHSNTANSLITNDKQSHQSRLDIIKEIGMAMEMRRKAELSNQPDDCLFWIDHIDKLNMELNKLKLHEDEKGSFHPQMTSRSKPQSILKNTNVNTIKIRAPMDMEAGQSFVVNVKGENIQATIVSHSK